METAKAIVAALFFLLGLLYIIKPEWAFRYRTWFARKLFGVKVIPGKRTYIAYRIVGAAFILIGFFIIYKK